MGNEGEELGTNRRLFTIYWTADEGLSSRKFGLGYIGFICLKVHCDQVHSTPDHITAVHSLTPFSLKPLWAAPIVRQHISPSENKCFSILYFCYCQSSFSSFCSADFNFCRERTTLVLLGGKNNVFGNMCKDELILMTL